MATKKDSVWARLWAWLAIALVLAMVAAACGDDAAEPAAEEPATEAPAEAPAEEPAAEPAEEPAEEPAAEPAEEPAEEPAAEPAEEPAEEPAAEPAEEPAEEPEEPTTLIVGTTFGWDSLDPADATDFGGYELLQNYNESLLTFVPGSTELQPGIAEMPEISDDGLTYTLRLRDGVTFGDGTELTAPMFVEQFQRALNLQGDTSSNVVPYIADVEAADDRTIVFTLNDRFAFFLNLLALPAYGPAHPDLFSADEIIRLPEAPIFGVGPWVISEFLPGEQVVMEPNPHYHGEAPKVDRVIMRQFADAQTEALALLSGEIHIASRGLQAENVAQLEGEDGVTVATVEGGLLLYYVVNSQLAPSDDSNVRQAVAALVDRDEIVDRVYGGLVEPLYSQIQPGILGANEAFDDRYASPNVDLALELLADSGYTEDNPVQIRIGFPGPRYGDASVDAQTVIKEQLESTGVIEVELESAEASAYFAALFGGETYNFGFLGFGFDFPDPDNHVALFIAEGGLGTGVTTADNVPTSDQAAELLALLEAGATTVGVDERIAIYENLQALYAEMVVTLPLYRSAPFIAYRDEVVADASLPAADALNVGALQTFNYSTLSLG